MAELCTRNKFLDPTGNSLEALGTFFLRLTNAVVPRLGVSSLLQLALKVVPIEHMRLWRISVREQV